MTRPKLTDLQRVLLALACSRADGSLLPPSEAVAGQTTRIRKAATTLIKHELAIEAEVASEAASWRTDEGKHYAVIVTDAGRLMIGPAEPVNDGVAPPVAALPGENAAAELVPLTPTTKIASITALLRRDGGATLTELVEATGWLPHTTRAALTG